MLHAVSVDAGMSVDEYHSPAGVNSFQTLDIQHYLIAEAVSPGNAPLRLRRVPMNVKPLELARLSDLAVTLSTRTLAHPEIQALQQRLAAALRAVEDGHLRHVNLTSSDRLSSRVYRRLVAALDWYRQSFGFRTRETEAVVALAVAFEALLTDYYAPGIADRLAHRVGLCLAENPRLAKYQASVHAVYRARNEIVHTGEGGLRTELPRAPAAFALCCCEVACRLDSLNRWRVEPIRYVLGDVMPGEFAGEGRPPMT